MQDGKDSKSVRNGRRESVLLLDLRNECRRLYHEYGCSKSISEKELEVLLASKALEI